ncbi:MAG TPA: CHC2 zinc finger domain-containing protein [Solirubrobacteraceae bacterium]|nr:CHC2 zinc finger domain-containing protein [Solirubrobacteraceae bacterium]
MAASPQEVALEIASDWLAEERWLAARRAELEAARRPPRPRRPLSRTVEELHDALLAVSADVWLPALTDLELPCSRTICCPLPGHEDRTPSCRIYDTSFYCFGCHRGGDIFAFAGELWGVPTHSRSFPALRERLADHLLGAMR